MRYLKTAISLLTAAIILASAGSGHSSNGKKNGSRSGQYYESKIYGTIEALPAEGTGIWIVNSRQILVTKDTRIKEEHGKIAPGAYVEVKGFFTGKEFVAREVEVKRDSRHARIYGVVEKIPATGFGTWIINGKEVSVTKDTIIDEEHGKPVVGAYVEVKANYFRGIYSARKIEVKRSPR